MRRDTSGGDTRKAVQKWAAYPTKWVYTQRRLHTGRDMGIEFFFPVQRACTYMWRYVKKLQRTDLGHRKISHRQDMRAAKDRYCDRAEAMPRPRYIHTSRSLTS